MTGFRRLMRRTGTSAQSLAWTFAGAVGAVETMKHFAKFGGHPCHPPISPRNMSRQPLRKPAQVMDRQAVNSVVRISLAGNARSFSFWTTYSDRVRLPLLGICANGRERE